MLTLLIHYFWPPSAARRAGLTRKDLSKAFPSIIHPTSLNRNLVTCYELSLQSFVARGLVGDLLRPGA
jgi:hypothetical protein